MKKHDVTFQYLLAAEGVCNLFYEVFPLGKKDGAAMLRYYSVSKIVLHK